MKESDSGDVFSEMVMCEVDDTTCSVCYAEFLDPEDLALHIKQVHPSLSSGSLVKCQFCKKCFTDAETYVLHIRDNHLLDFKSCSVCYRIFTSNSELKKHEQKHPLSMREGTFACSQCDQFFMYKSQLLVHEIDSHYDSEEGVFLNKHYDLLSSVINMKPDTFIRSIGNDKEGKKFTYTCARCKYRDVDLEAYILHLKRTNCRSLVCGKCFKPYNKRASLFYHVSQHPNCDIVKESHVNKKVMKSKQCSKCKGYFDRNVVKKHSCRPKINCSTCNTEFENMYELSEHQSKVHPVAVALVLCKFCPKECVGPDALEKHVQRCHDHELHLYKYTCTYCDTTFKHPKRLFAHYFLKHKDIQPYLCKICDKKFRVRKGFTLHIKLQHKSEGFVEFDEKLHVFFTDKKSEKPFQPVSIYVQEKDYDSEDIDISSKSKEKGTPSKEKDYHKKDSSSNSRDSETPTEAEEKEASSKSKENDNPHNSETETSSNNEKESSSKNKEKEATNASKDKEIGEIKELLASIDSDGDPDETGNKDNRVMALRKRKIDINDDDILALSDYDSEDEPLLLVKKKAKLKMRLRKKPLQLKRRRMKNTKNQFTCEICKKYCYTFQNYQNHVNMHFRDECKKCIKCSLAFKTKASLEKHMKDQHSSSQLTETLKNILERRKKGEEKQEKSETRKFLNTIKKVEFEKDNVTATLTPVTKELSVQKFIEDFKPEEGEKNVNAVNSVSITEVTTPVRKEPVIKMTKFKPTPEIREHVKLAMPVRFKKCNEAHSVTVRKVLARAPETQYSYDAGNEFQDDEDDYCCNDADAKDANIPEVEQEVTLEGDDDPKRNAATHKIVLPKLPKELKSIRIAHLLPEAPYYKIVKMDDIMKSQEKEPVKTIKEAPKDVRMPDGTKLVHVNPLAHLLGDTPVEQIMKTNKYYKYKPKAKNFEAVLANALRKLESPNKQKKKKEQKSKELIPEKASETVELSSETVNSNGNDEIAKENDVANTSREEATTDLVES